MEYAFLPAGLPMYHISFHTRVKMFKESQLCLKPECLVRHVLVVKAKYTGTEEGLKPQHGLAGCLCSTGYWKPDPVTAFGMDCRFRNAAAEELSKQVS